MTGYELTEDFRELKQDGHLGIVYKPLNGNSLARVVRQALDGDEGP